MSNSRSSLWYTVTVVGICLVLAGLVGCSKKAVKPTETGMEKTTTKETATTKQREAKLEVADITQSAPKETKFEIKDTQEVSSLKDVYFEFDQYNLTDQATEVLTKNADWLKDNPKVRILVEGHCDERGTVEYNMALGQKRATSVRDFLFSLGVKAERINTISYGKEKPIDPAHNEEAWARNRRTHMLVVK
jgi:peptidoglycan-associated lipoprotein